MPFGPTTPGLAFLSHPYHRGGVTTWMVDAARECTRRQRPCWFVAPEPNSGLLGAGSSPAVIGLLKGGADQPTLVAPRAGISFDFGTSGYRTSVLRKALATVPAGVPVIVSNDPDAWRAAAQLADRNPVIGVLHADEEAYYALARRYADSVAALVAVSNRIAANVRAASRSERPNVFVIPCGVRTSADPEPTRHARGTLRLIWAGRIDEHQKRVSDLVRIAAELHRRRVDFDCVVIGDGPDRAALERAAMTSVMRERFRFHRWASARTVREAMRDADVLVLPSNFEGMPVVAMEALAEGCAVVASRVSGIEDYEHSALAADCLRVHDIGDVEGAAAAVVDLTAIPSHVRRQRAWALARAEFDVGVSVDRYEAVAARATADVTRRRIAMPIRDVSQWRVIPRAWMRWVRTRVTQLA